MRWQRESSWNLIPINDKEIIETVKPREAWGQIALNVTCHLEWFSGIGKNCRETKQI